MGGIAKIVSYEIEDPTVDPPVAKVIVEVEENGVRSRFTCRVDSVVNEGHTVKLQLNGIDVAVFEALS